MTTLTREENGTVAAKASSKKPKAKKKPSVALRRAPVAPTKAKSPREATATKKARNGHPESQVAIARVARDGSKSAKMLDLLKRPGSARVGQYMPASRLASSIRERGLFKAHT